MKYIHDEKLLERLLIQEGIIEHFETSGLDFRLVEYEKAGGRQVAAGIPGDGPHRHGRYRIRPARPAGILHRGRGGPAMRIAAYRTEPGGA